MVVYGTVLPEVFPYKLEAEPEQVRFMVQTLLDMGQQGSNFAVTVDNWRGMWNLWVSAANFWYLKQKLNISDDMIKNRRIDQ